MSEKKYRLLIAYEGTDYAGWQVQPNGISVQEVLQQVLSQILQETQYITGSGRTDSGVHALGQVGHFSSEKPIECSLLQTSMNRLLPPAIRILTLEEVDPTFHARYSAKGKVYHYHLTIGARDPFRRRFSTHFPYSLDIEVMRAAAQKLIGTHDFTSFAAEASQGSAAKNAVRTIHRLDVIKEENGVCCEFEGNGFLYKMVRNIMGTLIEVSSGKREIAFIDTLLAAKDRRQAGRTAPPQGLFLVRVIY